MQILTKGKCLTKFKENIAVFLFLTLGLKGKNSVKTAQTPFSASFTLCTQVRLVFCEECFFIGLVLVSTSWVVKVSWFDFFSLFCNIFRCQHRRTEVLL